jgi:Protein of unknown function (DUF1579)
VRELLVGILDSLVACAGSWVGTNRLQDPHADSPEVSPATATVTPVLGGRFVRLDYTWAYRGTPQEGSLLIGYDAGAGEATAHLTDTWHMGDKVMACRGAVEPNGEISVRGSYAAPPGPDWGWRTVVTPAGQALRVVMYNVTPEGREELAVEAEYARA